jgi:hypothetical protein
MPFGISVGDVITLNHISPTGIRWAHCAGIHFDEGNISQFPANISILQWWEDRKPEEMPEYVKCIRGAKKGLYFKIADASQNFREWHNDGEIELIHFQRFPEFYEPATPADYEAQSNKKNKS